MDHHGRVERAVTVLTGLVTKTRKSAYAGFLEDALDAFEELRPHEAITSLGALAAWNRAGRATARAHAALTMLGVDGLALNSATHFACDVENALTSESLESVLAEAFWVRTHAPERNDDSANEGRVLPGDLEHPGVANAEREARAAIEGPWVLAELAGTYVTHYGSLRSAAQAHARTGALGPVELVPAASLELFACPPIQAIEVGRLTPELERTLEALAALVPEEGEFDLSELLAAAREL